MDFHTKSSKIKGYFKAKMKTFEVKYMASSPLKKVSTTSQVKSIVLRMLPDTIVVSESKHGDRKTSQSNFKIPNVILWRFSKI